MVNSGKDLPPRNNHNDRKFQFANLLLDGTKNAVWHKAQPLCHAMTTINTNATALIALDALRGNARIANKVSGQLSTGLSVTSATDNAALLGVSNVMTSRLQGVYVAMRNLNDGISLAQTADAALSAITDALQRMRELAVEASTGTLNDQQRGSLDVEYQALKQHILDVVQQTKWNGFRLFNELTPTSFELQAGPNANERITVNIPKIYASGQLVAFQNGDFESSAVGATSVSGWTVSDSRVKLDGVDQIGGWPTPLDTTKPAPSGGDTVAMSSGSFSTSVAANTGAGANPSGGAKSLQMQSTGVTVTGFGIVHGPYIISNSAVLLKSGDNVSFDWKAEGGGDAYDVYAYLLNVDNGSTVRLLDGTGSGGAMTTNWATVTTSVPADGNYKFVFVSGTFDASGGTAAGARLFIDNIVAPPTANPTLNSTDIATASTASQAMSEVDANMSSVDSARASIGASISRITYAADNLAQYSHRLADSRSRMVDTDYAEATMELSRTTIVESGATFVLGQSRKNSLVAVDMIRSNDRLFAG